MCKTHASNPATNYYTPWPTPQKPWHRIHHDFAGPLESKMWLVCTDAYLKYPYIGLTDVGKTTTENTIAMLEEIFVNEGFPDTVVTDNGPQFALQAFNTFCNRLGINNITTPPYHLASNGEAERFLRTLKTRIKNNRDDRHSLSDAIRMCLTTYRTLPHPMLDYRSPAMMLHKRQLKGNLELINLRLASHQPTTGLATDSCYAVGSSVYARN